MSIPNREAAEGAHTSIEEALSLAPPDGTRVGEDRLDLSALSLFNRSKQSQALSAVDPRVDEIRRNVERLVQAMKMRDRSTVDHLLASIEEKVDALVNELSM